MSSHERIASILGDWQSRRDRGEGVTPEEVIAQNPDLAAALRARFSALGALRGAADRAAGTAGGVRLRTLPLERYRDFKKVGHGGMGIVYWALDTELNRHVAFKVGRAVSDPPRHGDGRCQTPLDTGLPPGGRWHTSGAGRPPVIPAGRVAEGRPRWERWEPPLASKARPAQRPSRRTPLTSSVLDVAPATAPSALSRHPATAQPVSRGV